MYRIFYVILVVIINTSCFNEVSEFEENINPFDGNYIYDFVEFQKVTITETGLQCREDISVVLTNETFIGLSKINAVPHSEIYLVVDLNVPIGPFGILNHYSFTKIKEGEPFILETNPFRYDCDDVNICVDVKIIRYIPATNWPGSVATLEYTESQEICFDRM